MTEVIRASWVAIVLSAWFPSLSREKFWGLAVAACFFFGPMLSARVQSTVKMICTDSYEEAMPNLI